MLGVVQVTSTSVKSWAKSMSENLIECKPEVLMGRPVIAGTRITVELILEKLASGETIEQILAAHPRLTKPAILAAIDFAAQVLRADIVYPLAGQLK